MLLYFALTLLMVWAAWSAESTLKQSLAVIFSIGICTYLFHFTRLSFKDSPKIKIDEEHISFNEEYFHLKDIKKIDYTGKQYIGKYFLRITHGEEVRIYFGNGTEKVILDNTYWNSSDIKLYLQKTIGKDKQPNTRKSKDKTSLDDSLSYQEYKGAQLLSFFGFYILLILVPVVYITLFKTVSLVMPNFLYLILFILLWTVVWSFFLNYFRLSSHHLTVKNHNLFWKRDRYTLSTIREVVFEAPISARFGATGLRVITNDFKTKLYQADSLSNKTWLRLKADLEKHGIRVRNECISKD